MERVGVVVLSKEQRKEAATKFKEREPAIGIFAVRCAATGEVWVGASRNLDSAQNSNWFGLRGGAHRDKVLQEAWNAQGEGSFAYEVLEKFKEVHPLAVADLLNEKRKHWIGQLGARLLL